MLDPIDFLRAHTIIEFGPGTGAFTAEIKRRMAPDNRYVGIEINRAFCRSLTAKFPGLDFVQGSVEDLRAIMTSQGVEQIDAIVCGLPWASLPVAIQEHTFDAINDFLAADGIFVTFAYLQGLTLPGARALRRLLQTKFAEVHRSPIVWRNIPPAFAYICRGNVRAL